jgi:hypothetical protein
MTASAPLTSAGPNFAHSNAGGAHGVPIKRSSGAVNRSWGKQGASSALWYAACSTAALGTASRIITSVAIANAASPALASQASATSILGRPGGQVVARELAKIMCQREALDMDDKISSLEEKHILSLGRVARSNPDMPPSARVLTRVLPSSS